MTMDYEQITEEVKKRLSEKRFQHSKRAAEIASLLAACICDAIDDNYSLRTCRKVISVMSVDWDRIEKCKFSHPQIRKDSITGNM